MPISAKNQKLLKIIASLLPSSTLSSLERGEWNPIDSNNAAFKLAVFLSLVIHPPTEKYAYAKCHTSDGTLESILKADFTDPFKSVRKVIVMTAVKMAKTPKLTKGIFHNLEPKEYLTPTFFT